MPLPMSRRLMLAPALAALVLSAACVDIIGQDLSRYVEREEKRFTITGIPDVELSTFDGAIEVRPWDRAEVLVVIEKRGIDKTATGGIEVISRQDGNRVIVEARYPRDGSRWGLRDSPSATLVVSVPVSTNVAARSGDGSIEIERISGRFDLSSGDGTIRARELTGDLRLHTGDGSIRADGKLSALRATTGDGSISIQASPGSTAADDWDIRTGDGSVTVELPEGFGAELDAHTGDGRIDADDIAIASRDGHDSSRRSLRATLGSGGRTVRVRTGDGSITLRRF